MTFQGGIAVNIKDCEVIEEMSGEYLQKAVALKIEKGRWQPFGSLTICKKDCYNTPTIIYAQAIVQYNLVSEKRIMDYAVISEDSIGALNRSISRMLERDWQPFSPVCLCGFSNKMVYACTMVKYSKV